MTHRKIVLGLGNPMFRDEGLGVYALQAARAALQEQVEVEWVEGGELGLNLLPLIESCSHLLVLDALDSRSTPGAVQEISKEELPLESGQKGVKHQLGFEEVLELAHYRRTLPEKLHLIGVQPADLSQGPALSPSVEAALPEVVRRTQAVLDSW